MTTENSKPDFKTRLINFVNTFDSSPSDYLFDSAQYSRDKLQELEARIARLESTPSPVAEIQYDTAS
jgi:hypothetical protein